MRSRFIKQLHPLAHAQFATFNSVQRLSPKKGASDECSLPGVRHTIDRCINRRAQQHIHHLPRKRGRIADVNCRLRACDVIKSRMGPHRLPAWGGGQWTGNRKFIWGGLTFDIIAIAVYHKFIQAAAQYTAAMYIITIIYPINQECVVRTIRSRQYEY